MTAQGTAPGQGSWCRGSSVSGMRRTCSDVDVVHHSAMQLAHGMAVCMVPEPLALAACSEVAI